MLFLIALEMLQIVVNKDFASFYIKVPQLFLSTEILLLNFILVALFYALLLLFYVTTFI